MKTNTIGSLSKSDVLTPNPSLQVISFALHWRVHFRVYKPSVLPVARCVRCTASCKPQSLTSLIMALLYYLYDLLECCPKFVKLIDTVDLTFNLVELVNIRAKPWLTIDVIHIILDYITSNNYRRKQILAVKPQILRDILYIWTTHGSDLPLRLNQKCSQSIRAFPVLFANLSNTPVVLLASNLTASLHSQTCVQWFRPEAHEWFWIPVCGSKEWQSHASI